MTTLLAIITGILIVIALKVTAIRKAIGLTFIIFGILISLTILGVIIGLPMVFVGALLLFVESRRKKIISDSDI